MMITIRSALALVALLNFSVSISKARADVPPLDMLDPYLWLEEIQGTRSIDWVKDRNVRSLAIIQSDARYATLLADIRKIVLATDRIPAPEYRAGYVYNFWQDTAHVRGIWRRAELVEYRKADPTWETIVDLDELATAENENWVWHGADCRMPANDRCLISLSHGGKDASVIREFDMASKTFVSNGFVIPESKAGYTWVDRDTLLVGPDLGAGSMTDSGYPRQVRVWRRGTPLTDSTLIFNGEAADVGVWPGSLAMTQGRVLYLERATSFYSSRKYILRADYSLEEMPIPLDATIRAAFGGQLIVNLKSDWAIGGLRLFSGSLVALSTTDLTARPELIYAPTARSTVESVWATQDRLYVQTLDNVSARVMAYALPAAGAAWLAADVAIPDHGSVIAATSDSLSNEFIVTFESFLVPTTQFLGTLAASGVSVSKLRQIPSRYDTSGLKVDQWHATSKDGTDVPYFIVRRANLTLDGSNPTLLYGYGGFEISMTPYYMSSYGKGWLEKGGVYVLANIRGGGEFGPAWHQGAILKNKQRSYDDFIAIAEDLIAKKVTTPRRLGIEGGSNGGLLMGVMLTQRPDLFNAVVCQVPLLDMLRFHKLLAGASWMGEYGNPEDPEMATVLSAYSPYQNLKVGQAYPKIFFLTSTADDRVHPGHARKMAAKLEGFGQDYLFFENTEGGHGAAANLEERARRQSLEMIYLYQQLFD